LEEGECERTRTREIKQDREKQREREREREREMNGQEEIFETSGARVLFFLMRGGGGWDII